MRIVSPAGFDGVTSFGPVEIVFRQGVADVDALPDAVRSYLVQAGYEVESGKPRRTTRRTPDA